MNWATSMRRECLSLENFPASFGHPAWKDYARHLMSTEHTRSRVLSLKEIICNIISSSQVGPSFCLIMPFCIKQEVLKAFTKKSKISDLASPLPALLPGQSIV